MSDNVSRSTHAADHLALALVLLAFVAVHFATLTRVPFPYIDEVLMAEPAINFAAGRGFTSAAWLSGSEEIWGAPQPLYPLYLSAWVRSFGGSQASVRCGALFLAATGIALIWIAAARLRIVNTTAGRVWMSALIICDYGYAYAYKFARPEPLAVFACALMFFAFSLRPALRFPLLFLCAFFVPSIGLQVVAFLLMLGLVVVVALRRKVMREALVVGAGLGLGILAFYLVYQHLGIWGSFLKELEHNGSTSLLQRVRERLTTNPLATHSHTIPKDFSMVWMGLAILVTTVLLAKRRALSLTSLPAIGLMIAIVIPAGMYLGLRFSTYYSWVMCVPLAVIYNGVWERPDLRTSRKWMLALQLVACLVGLPLMVAASFYDWRERNPRPVDEFVAAAVNAGDVVFCDHTAYFPTKPRARAVYLPMYLHRITPAEAARVTVAIVNDHPTPPLMMTKEQQLTVLGGGWTKVSEYQPGRGSLFGNDWQLGFSSMPNYALEIYRRPAPAVR